MSVNRVHFTSDSVLNVQQEINNNFNTLEDSKVDKTTTIAGINLQDNISKSELLEALNVEDGAQKNAVESVNNKTGAVSLVAGDVDAYTKAETQEYVAQNTVQDANYVHTDNNYTTAEKQKLSGIASGAEVNVQSDWLQTNINSDDFIKNKPTELSQFNQDSTHRLVTDNEKAIWNSKQDALTIDSVPTENSTNPVTSGGVYTKTSQLNEDINAIEEKIPTQATSSNQLADKDFVNSSINALAAFYITKNLVGDPFATKSELNNTVVFYSGGNIRIPTTNDYCIILADETKTDAITGEKPTTRYSYQNNQWEFQYIVNNTALTAAQLAALNSGITSEKVSQIETNKSDISNLSANKQDIISDLATIRSKADTAVQPGDLSTVATSGNYNDLDNRPTIPTVNDATLTIQKEGTTVGTFSSNASSNETINIEETDPVFSASAAAGITSNDINNWDAKSDFSGSYFDLSDKPTIPSALSELSDDSTHRLVTDTQKSTWNAKQDALISGTNIKTINNTSLLGSGDVAIELPTVIWWED